ELDGRDVDHVAALLVQADRGGDQRADFPDARVDLPGGGIGSHDLGDAPAINDHGDREARYGEAVGDGGGALGVEFVVGRLLAPLALFVGGRAGAGLLFGIGQVLVHRGGCGLALLAGGVVGAHHLDGALDARIRAEDDFFRLAAVGVDDGAHAGAEIVGTEIGGQRAADVVFHLRFHRLFDGQRTVDAGVGGIVARGEQRAAGIEDRHVVRFQTRHGGRDE